MAFTVEEMFTGSNGIVLRNESIWRPPTFRHNWSRMRLGYSTHVPADSNTLLSGRPRFYVGFCNDAGGGPTVENCGHFVGMRTNNSWTYSQGTNYASFRYGISTDSDAAGDQIQRVHTVNGVESVGLFAPAGDYRGSWNPAGAIATSNGLAYRVFTILEIERTGTGLATMRNIRLASSTGASNAYQAMTSEFFYNAIESADALSVVEADFPANSHYQESAEFSLDEGTNGVIDAVAWGWGQSFPQMLVGHVLVGREA
jgi:hypothetical protein